MRWLAILITLTFYKVALCSVEIHGHRGSRGTHPENSLQAFFHAHKAGADVLELDLQLTREGTPVIAHFPYLSSKTCKGPTLHFPVAIGTLTLPEFSRFDCGAKPHPAFPKQKTAYAPGLSLFSFLQWVSHHAIPKRLNMEIKMSNLPPPDPKLFARAVLKDVRHFGLEDQIIIQSFDPEALRAVATLNSNIALSLLTMKQQDFCEQARSLRVKMVSPDFQSVSKSTLQLCKQLGIAVVPYTPNTLRDWTRLIALGVDGIITDYPAKLSKSLRQ